MPVFVPAYDGEHVFGDMELKVALAIAQLLGYGLAKPFSVVYVSTLKRPQWGAALAGLGFGAFMPFLLHGLFPASPAVLVGSVFLSALCLSPIWGVFLRYMEGRQESEALMAAVSLSYIGAAGAARSTASALVGTLSVHWIPFAVGVVAYVIFLAALWVLVQTPPPTAADIKARSRREPMTKEGVHKFLSEWWPGLACISLSYAITLAYRSYRDYFQPDIWKDLEGHKVKPRTFTISEIVVGAATLLCVGAVYKVKDNRRAFYGFLVLMIGGSAFIGLSSAGHHSGILPPMPYMICTGLGVYSALTPPGVMLFDRLMGVTGHDQTSTWLVYTNDGLGYVGSLAMLLYKNWGSGPESPVAFFTALGYVTGILCTVMLGAALLFFHSRLRTQHPIPLLDTAADDQRDSAVEYEEQASLLSSHSSDSYDSLGNS